VTLVLLPLYVSLRSHQFRGGFWIGLACVAIFGAINLTSFGSKNSAIFPLVVFVSISFLSGRLRIIRLVVPALVILSIYLILNPWYFREQISYGSSTSRLELLKESAKGVETASTDLTAVDVTLLSLRNFSHRVTSIIPMQIAIDVSVPFWETVTAPGIIWNTREYYNEVVLTPVGSSNALGHFGFFMIMFRNHVLGFVIGCVLLVAYFCVCLHLDKKAAISNRPYYVLESLVFVLTLLPFLLDGNYSRISGYMHMGASLLCVRYILSPLLVGNLPGDGRKCGQSGEFDGNDAQTCPSGNPLGEVLKP
jgi:hypothetical protein